MSSFWWPEEPCTKFDIYIEQHGQFVPITPFNLNAGKYLLRSNQITILSREENIRLTLPAVEEVTGVKINFTLPVSCKLEEVSFHDIERKEIEAWNKDDHSGKQTKSGT